MKKTVLKYFLEKQGTSRINFAVLEEGVEAPVFRILLQLLKYRRKLHKAILTILRCSILISDIVNYSRYYFLLFTDDGLKIATAVLSLAILLLVTYITHIKKHRIKRWYRERKLLANIKDRQEIYIKDRRRPKVETPHFVELGAIPNVQQGTSKQE